MNRSPALATLLVVLAGCAGLPPAEEPGWELVWADEFDAGAFPQTMEVDYVRVYERR